MDNEHYTAVDGYEPWDVMAAWYTPEEFQAFLKLTIVKYLHRAGKKSGEPAMKDLRKARHYLSKLIETLEN